METEDTMSTDDSMSMAQFIDRFGITMTATHSGTNASRPWPKTESEKRWDRDAFHWTVVLHCGSRTMEIGYSRGPAHRYRKRKAMSMNFTIHEERLESQYPEPPYIDSHTPRAWGQPIPPLLAEVLDALAIEAASFENAPDFASWAEEFGYDEDSHRARLIHEAVGKQTRELIRLLGRETYELLLWEVDK